MNFLNNFKIGDLIFVEQNGPTVKQQQNNHIVSNFIKWSLVIEKQEKPIISDKMKAL